MFYIQEPMNANSSPSSREGRTPQNERTPRNLKSSPTPNRPSSYEILKTPKSNSSFEDFDSFCENNKTLTPTPTMLIGHTGTGKSSLVTCRTNIQKVILDFTNISFEKDTVRQSTDARENFQNLKELELIIRNQEKEFISEIKEQLSKIFYEKPNSLQSFELDLFRSQIATECVDHLNEESLLNFRSLKKFKINLWGSDINNLSIQRFAWNFKHFFAELEEFHLNLGQTKVTEKVMIQFFHEMPKMKHFEMRVGNCLFNDYSLKIFIRNTLSSMKSLESLSFQLEGTKISSSQVQDLFKNLPESLKKLRLDLRWTRICDDAFEYFIKEKLSILEDLKEIEFKIDCTLLSEKMVKKVEEINKKYVKKIDHETCSKYLKSLRFNENLLKSVI